MTTFIILFRNSRGNTDTTSIQANSASEAKSIFMRIYDGRIISIDAA